MYPSFKSAIRRAGSSKISPGVYPEPAEGVEMTCRDLGTTVVIPRSRRRRGIFLRLPRDKGDRQLFLIQKSSQSPNYGEYNFSPRLVMNKSKGSSVPIPFSLAFSYIF